MEFIADIKSFAISLAEVNLLTPIVLAVSSIVALTGIVITLWSNRKVVKDRETVTYILNRHEDESLRDGIKTILKIEKSDTDIREHAKKEDRETEESFHIKYVINHFEYLCTGINHNIYNEKMLQDATITSTIDLFKALKPYIDAIRDLRTQRSAYVEFETVYTRWSKRAQKIHKANLKNGNT